MKMQNPKYQGISSPQKPPENPARTDYLHEVPSPYLEPHNLNPDHFMSDAVSSPETGPI